MLKEKVIDAALAKVLADEDLTFAHAIRLVAKAEHQEEYDAYQVHYGRFIATVGKVNTTQRREDVYIELARRFIEFLRKNSLLEPAVAAASTTTVYKPDEFDFTDWDAIRRASGF